MQKFTDIIINILNHMTNAYVYNCMNTNMIQCKSMKPKIYIKQNQTVNTGNGASQCINCHKLYVLWLSINAENNVLHWRNTFCMPIWWASLLICILKEIISKKLWQHVVIQQPFLLWVLQTTTTSSDFTKTMLCSVWLRNVYYAKDRTNGQISHYWCLLCPPKK